MLNDVEKHKSPLKDLISLKELKYKEIDELAEIITNWKEKNPFEIEKLR